MSFSYAVIGAGRQGLAAAYDLAVHGDASNILFLDAHEDAAHAAAARVNALVGRDVADGERGDASNPAAIASRLAGTRAIHG